MQKVPHHLAGSIFIKAIRRRHHAAIRLQGQRSYRRITFSRARRKVTAPVADAERIEVVALTGLYAVKGCGLAILGELAERRQIVADACHPMVRRIRRATIENSYII